MVYSNMGSISAGPEEGIDPVTIQNGCAAEEWGFGARSNSKWEVVVTDTLPIAPDRRIEKLAVLSVSKLIADAIDAVFEDTSVSEIFGGENLA